MPVGDLASGKVDVVDYAQGRANEVKSLCDALSSGENRLVFGHDALSRSAQRRTTSHRSKRHRRRPNEKRQKRRRVGQSSQGNEEIPLCREARRRKKFQDVRNSIPVSGSLRYLETHKWYAKRQKMVQLWGHHLPQGMRGKGLGLAGFCSKLRHGLIAHDMSYYWSLRLSGPGDLLLRVLGLHCCEGSLPSPSELSVSPDVFEHEATFHERCKSPRGALSPLLITWTRGGGDGDRSSWRPLLWVHCQSYSRVKEALEKTIESIGSESGVERVDLACLESQIKRMEVRGSASRKVIERILRIPREKLNNLSSAGIDSRRGWCRAEHLNLLDPRLQGILSKGSKYCDPQDHQSKVDRLNTASASAHGTHSARLEAFETKPMSEEVVGKLHRKANLMHDVFDALSSDHRSEMGFPLVVVGKNSGEAGFAEGKPLGGYSFLFPKSWTHALWMPLVTSGAGGVGLREWKWYAQLCGRGVYPDSYPELRSKKLELVEYATNGKLQVGKAAEEEEAGALDWSACVSTGKSCENREIFVARGGHAAGWSESSDPNCLVRVLLLLARKGTMNSWTRVYKPTASDLATFAKGSGSETYEACGEERSLLGYVTLGVLPKKCKGFEIQAEAFCQAKGMAEARDQQEGKHGDKVLVILVCKGGVLRPAFAKVVQD